MKPRDPDPTHRPDQTSALLRKLLAGQETTNRLLKGLMKMTDQLDTEIATETAEEAALAAAVAKNTETLTTLQGQLAAALASATAAGATPEQLAAFDAIHAKVSADIDALGAADAPEAPAT